VTDELAAKARARSDSSSRSPSARGDLGDSQGGNAQSASTPKGDVFGKITIKRYVPRPSKDFELALYQT
jgi:hypothetical protein